MKRVLAWLLALITAASLLSVTAYAETYSDKAIIIVSGKTVTVGSTVTVTVSHTASYAMSAIEGTLTYNNAVLQFVSGEKNNTSNQGSTVKIVKDSAPTNSISVTVKFKAIAAGSGSLSYKGDSYSDKDDGNAAAGTAITVKEDKPSANNDLGSLKISSGRLTPAFSKGRLNYTATVGYDVTKITISANAAAGDSKVAGVGTFDLNVGNNTRSVTVTAASGDRKTYTVTVKRKSEEEEKEEEEKERENDPLWFSDNGEDRRIVSDIADMPDLAGYDKDSFGIDGVSIGYFKDKAGKYNLVWATDEDGENGRFYNREADGVYTEINYLQTDGYIYVIEPFESDIEVSDGFILSSCEINGTDVECYRYNDAQDGDYCVLYCYADGESGYYRFNALQNTVEPEPAFPGEIEDAETETAAVSKEDVFGGFGKLSNQAKILILLLGISGLLIILLIVLLIVKTAKGKATDFENDFEPAEDTGGVLTPSEEAAEEALPEPPGSEVAQEPAAQQSSGEENDIPEEPEPAAEEEDFPDEESAENADTDTSEFIDTDDF